MGRGTRRTGRAIVYCVGHRNDAVNICTKILASLIFSCLSEVMAALRLQHISLFFCMRFLLYHEVKTSTAVTIVTVTVIIELHTWRNARTILSNILKWNLVLKSQRIQYIFTRVNSVDPLYDLKRSAW